MITLNNLTIQHGDKHLFKNVSCQIYEHDRIGLGGVNGAGKSTLLKILAGVTECESGEVTQSRQTTVGYLPQEISEIDIKQSLYDEAKTAFADLISKQKKLEKIHDKLSKATNSQNQPETDSLIRQQGELQHDLDQSGVYIMDAQISKILSGLGFKEKDFDRECSSFSGGWLMRLMLAKQLLAAPSFLFLDEPTNHLDIATLRWLEDFLSSFPGGLVIISHDRAFLDNMTTTTWELSMGILNVYKGNYSKYLVEKEQRLIIQRSAYDNQQAQIKQTERFVQRFRAKSTKAKQVQSRVKQLAKMERIELGGTESHISFQFPPAAPSGRTTLEVASLIKSYDSNQVLDGVSFDLQRGDKIAIVGVNGAGKSTLVKILAGLVPHDSGTVRFGHNVTPAYFGQHQAQELSPDYTALETLNMVENDKTLTQTRSLLGAFLFSGDDVDKKVQVLSGGEKSRLALARMIATPANLLIMDEPTNHLDMISQEILQDALRQYDGTIIIVSHNRYFLDQFVNKVLEIKDRKSSLYEGNISRYLEKLDELAEQEIILEKASPDEKKKPEPSASKGKKQRQEQAKIRQEMGKRMKPYREITQKAEQQIEKLESRKSELEQLLADPELYNNQDRFSKVSVEYSEVEMRLNRIMFKWEEAQENVEKIEAEYPELS
jgi:ATP-binding cassette, subfamily F, member 3